MRSKVSLAGYGYSTLHNSTQIMGIEKVVHGTKTVIIVGAGAAGLQAANTLLESEAFLNGCLKVLVLEARDRVGGRVCVSRRWDVPFDQGRAFQLRYLVLGPNWIHGTVLNPLVPLAEMTSSCLTTPEEGGCLVYSPSGERLPTETSRLLYETIWSYAALAIQCSAQIGAHIPPSTSLYDFCHVQISHDKDLPPELEETALQMTDLLTTFTAVSVTRQSLRHYQVEATLPVLSQLILSLIVKGDTVFIASTFEPIISQLALPAAAAGVLQLSSAVSKVDVQIDHIVVTTDRTEFRADAVILTTPLGCLQRNTIDFTPPLPLQIQSAIQNLGFGNLEKLFLRFERAWWLTHPPSDPSQISIFLPPTTLPNQAPQQLLTMFSLADIPINAQPVLAFYLAGAWTTYIKSISQSDISTLFQTHYLPCLPNYSPECKIMDLFCTTWTEDPFTYGSYTHIPVGSEDGINDLRVLGERICGLKDGSGGLWFAGEHAGTVDMGTVNGAMTSGNLAALDVLKSFGFGSHSL